MGSSTKLFLSKADQRQMQYTDAFLAKLNRLRPLYVLKLFMNKKTKCVYGLCSPHGIRDEDKIRWNHKIKFYRFDKICDRFNFLVRHVFVELVNLGIHGTVIRIM